MPWRVLGCELCTNKSLRERKHLEDQRHCTHLYTPCLELEFVCLLSLFDFILGILIDFHALVSPDRLERGSSAA